MRAINIDTMQRYLPTLMLVLACTSPVNAGAAPPLRSSFDLQVPMPPTVVTVAGTPRLFYELHLSNFAQDALTLRRVQIIDTEHGNTIADVDDGELDRRLGRPGLPVAATDRRVIASGMRAVIYLEPVLDARVLPRTLKHRVEYTAADTGTREPEVVEGARTPVQSGTLPVLGPPLRGGPWAAIHEPSWERGHRRVLYAVDGRVRIPGRHAIDWVKLDANGRYANGDDDKVSNWLGYGEDVLAVADGVIAATRDSITESASVAAHPKHTMADASGNYIALDLGNGRHAFYEHLKPGSLRVKPGDRVRRGQVLAALGFTGDSTGPHLHFHVADGNSPLAAEGLPYVLQRFDLLGRYDTLDTFGNRRWPSLDNADDARRHAELPAPNAVVEFPAEPIDQ
ncbi:M23 family metallopeptidase [Lysobacter cavernae]|uniref:M23 family metallopeptidase n=1 Tax=Lysobacter cavernae TaxID=1685901 RepID=A0ABV7RP14_9GAMM